MGAAEEDVYMHLRAAPQPTAPQAPTPGGLTIGLALGEKSAVAGDRVAKGAARGGCGAGRKGQHTGRQAGRCWAAGDQRTHSCLKLATSGCPRLVVLQLSLLQPLRLPPSPLSLTDVAGHKDLGLAGGGAPGRGGARLGGGLQLSPLAKRGAVGEAWSRRVWGRGRS